MRVQLTLVLALLLVCSFGPHHSLGKTDELVTGSFEFSWKEENWTFVRVDGDGEVVDEVVDLKPAVYALELASERASCTPAGAGRNGVRGMSSRNSRVAH